MIQDGAKVRKPTGSRRLKDSQKESRSVGFTVGHLVRTQIIALTPPIGRLI